MNTIFALSSGFLPSGVAIIRVSGKQTAKIVQDITKNSLPKPRYFKYTKFYTETDELIDTGMVVFFKKPFSFTGEDCAEFHIHGSKATVALFLEVLSNFKYSRMALAGEFSQRAFLNGKMDLLQAESLADLLEAETEAQRKLTIAGTTKQLSELYIKWRNILLNSMASLTAILDFSEEEDVNYIDNTKIWDSLKELVYSIEKHISYAKCSDIIQNGLKIVLIGKPNVGKSSLLNKICNKDIAIVSDIEGTTRDILEGKLILNGINVFFYDTAGLRKTTDAIEKLGINKTKNYIKEADIIFHLSDISDINDNSNIEIKNNIWKINTKCDVSRETLKNKNEFYISIYNDNSILELIEAVKTHIKQFKPKYNDILPAKQRHINLLKQTIYDINIAINENNLPIEIRAEYIRNATQHIGRIIGTVDVESILDVVFSKFCIGK